MKEFLWIGHSSWVTILVNAVCAALNVASYTMIAPSLVPSMGIGFHIGLIFSTVLIDRLFFAEGRSEIQRIRKWLNEQVQNEL